jgi:uncharacterized membrane protein (UPF0127 family)
MTAVELESTSGTLIRVQAEVAATDETRQKGLMFRKELSDGEGMLFVFDEEREHTFWMKNTFVPLDMLFIASDKTVAGIVHEARPLDTRSLTIGLPSRYVLEVPAGFCVRKGIHRGAKAKFAL